MFLTFLPLKFLDHHLLILLHLFNITLPTSHYKHHLPDPECNFDTMAMPRVGVFKPIACTARDSARVNSTHRMVSCPCQLARNRQRLTFQPIVEAQI